MSDDCLFCKIIAGEIPSKKVYEDDFCYAFDEAGEHVIDTVSKVNPGDHLSVRLHDGELGCEVVTVQGFEEKGSTEDE